jgi:predicted RNA polymerase sigma factor
MSADAAVSYLRALTLVSNESERRFLERRLREMQALDPVTRHHHQG